MYRCSYCGCGTPTSHKKWCEYYEENERIDRQGATMKNITKLIGEYIGYLLAGTGIIIMVCVWLMGGGV